MANSTLGKGDDYGRFSVDSNGDLAEIKITGRHPGGVRFYAYGAFDGAAIALKWSPTSGGTTHGFEDHSDGAVSLTKTGTTDTIVSSRLEVPKGYVVASVSSVTASTALKVVIEPALTDF